MQVLWEDAFFESRLKKLEGKMSEQGLEPLGENDETTHMVMDGMGVIWEYSHSGQNIALLNRASP